MREPSTNLQLAIDCLGRYGLLLESDRALPSVVSLIAAEPVSGSWWGHPLGEAIHQVTRQLADHPDVLVTKLVSGKVTYVHRRLWSVVLALGLAREPWQLMDLSSVAHSLLDAVDQNDELPTDEVPWFGGPNSQSPAEAARQLERRLLVHGQETHTEGGAHAKRLETWQRWAKRVEWAGKGVPPERAKKELEELIEGLNAEFEAKARLPWIATSRRVRGG